MSFSACSFQAFPLATTAWGQEAPYCSCLPGPVDKVIQVAATIFLAMVDLVLLPFKFCWSVTGLNNRLSNPEVPGFQREIGGVQGESIPDLNSSPLNPEVSRFQREIGSVQGESIPELNSSPINLEVSRFQREIEGLKGVAIGSEDFNLLFTELLASPLADDNWKAWTGLMEQLLKKLMDSQENPKSFETILASHLRLAKLMPDSPELLTRFCRYLRLTHLVRYDPWIGYAVFDAYCMNSQTEETYKIACNETKNFLNDEAASRLMVVVRPKQPREIDIDPRIWFGRLTETEQEIPVILARVLYDQISKFYQAHNSDLRVSMIGRAETRLPKNFTLYLAELITHDGIWLEHNGTIDSIRLSRPGLAV